MDEPIAIIGLDARLPSDGGSAEGFFDSLVAGKSARREVPSDRFNVDAFWHPDKDRSGSVCTRRYQNKIRWLSVSRLLPASVTFSAAAYQPLMHHSSQPHPQRLMAWIPSSEECWSVLTRLWKTVSYAVQNDMSHMSANSHSITAGIPLEAAAGTQTGVYVGCFTADYNDITVKDLDVPSKYAATGTVASMLSNRISWFFDFHGPSITVDTACSSSLVAVHEACMSLRLREISMVRLSKTKSKNQL